MDPLPTKFIHAPPRRQKISHEQRLAKSEADMRGQGSFLFQNNSRGDLHLPRATKDGRRIIPQGAQFIGDDYYFQMVKSNELRFIREIVEEKPPMPEKLITEQPPVVTAEGTVEHVAQNSPQPIQEQEEILLREAPLEGIVILD